MSKQSPVTPIGHNHAIAQGETESTQGKGSQRGARLAGPNPKKKLL